MNGRIRLAALALCLVLGVIWVAGGAGPPKAAETERFRGDVIMMRCATDGPTFRVTGFGGSTQAPGKKAEVCPEELSLLLRDGFTIRDVGHSDVDKKYVVYTLTR